MRLKLHPLTESNTIIPLTFSTPVERVRWSVTPPPAICAEARCPVSSRLYNGLRGNDLRVIETRPTGPKVFHYFHHSYGLY